MRASADGMFGDRNSIRPRIHHRNDLRVAGSRLSTPTPVRLITRPLALATKAVDLNSGPHQQGIGRRVPDQIAVDLIGSNHCPARLAQQADRRSRHFSATTIFMSMIPLQESYSFQTLTGFDFPTLNLRFHRIRREIMKLLSNCACACHRMRLRFTLHGNTWRRTNYYKF